MNGELTQKQWIFTRNLFMGMTQYEAYRKAGYGVMNQDRVIVESNASRLASNEKVKDKLRELNDTVAIVSIANVEERKQKLTQILRDTHKIPLTAKEKIMAIAELNKMGGDYAPERHAVLGDIRVEVTYVNRDRNQRPDNNQDKPSDSALPPG